MPNSHPYLSRAEIEYIVANDMHRPDGQLVYLDHQIFREVSDDMFAQYVVGQIDSPGTGRRHIRMTRVRGVEALLHAIHRFGVGQFHTARVRFLPIVGYGVTESFPLDGPIMEHLLEAIGGFYEHRGDMDSAARYLLRLDDEEQNFEWVLAGLFGREVQLILEHPVVRGRGEKKHKKATKRIGKYWAHTEETDDGNCWWVNLGYDSEHRGQRYWVRSMMRDCDWSTGSLAAISAEEGLHIAQKLGWACRVVREDGFLEGEVEGAMPLRTMLLAQGHWWRVEMEAEYCCLCSRFHKLNKCTISPSRRRQRERVDKTECQKTGFYDLETRPERLKTHSIVMTMETQEGKTIHYTMEAQEHKAFCCCARDDDGEATFWGTDCVFEFLRWTKTRRTKSWFAHNGARFDGYFVLNAALQMELEEDHPLPRLDTYPPSIEELVDTIKIEDPKNKASIHVIKNGSRLLKIKFQDKREFLCTLQHLRMKLSMLGKAFGLPKELWKDVMFKTTEGMKTNLELLMMRPELSVEQFLEFLAQNPELEKHLRDYCMQDVVALQSVWKMYATIVHSITKIDPARCLTGSSLTYKAWKQSVIAEGMCEDKEAWSLVVPEHWMVQGLSAEEFLRKAVLGGRSEIREVCWKKEPFVLVDIVSMYPAAMAFFEFPKGEPKVVTDVDDPETFGIYVAEICNCSNIEYFPIALRVAGHPLQWKLGSRPFVASCTTIDIVMIRSMGGTVHVKYGLEFPERWNPFQQYIEPIFAKKQDEDRKKLAGEPFNIAMRTVLKSLLNELYGKMLQKTPTGDIAYYRPDQLPADSVVTQAMGSYVQTFQGKKRLQHKPYWLGVWILSLSRWMLQGYLEMFGRDQVWAIETDSFLIPEPVYHRCKDKKMVDSRFCVPGKEFTWEVSKALGAVDAELFFDEIALLQPKCSYMHCADGYERCKMKGVPVAVVDDEGKETPLLTRKLYEDFYRQGFIDIDMKSFQAIGLTANRLPGILMKKVHKTLRLKQLPERWTRYSQEFQEVARDQHIDLWTERQTISERNAMTIQQSPETE